MSVAPRGPKEYRLTDLDPDRFETLAFLLARAENPGVVRIRRKDHGLDARLPTPSGQTVRGWQAKRFTDGIKWSDCYESVRRALAFWRPLRITFVFATDLSAKDQAEFTHRLVAEFPLIRLDWWDASEINARLHESEAGRRAARWAFKEDDDIEEAWRRAFTVGGELRHAGQAAIRVAEVQEFMRERDPYLHYTILTRDREGPETPPAKETLLSITTNVEGATVRLDAAERYSGAAADVGLGGRLLFPDTPEGRRAKAALDRALERGERVRLSSGVKADFSVPPGLRGIMPEEPIDVEVEIRPSVYPRNERRAAPGFPTLVRCAQGQIGIVLVQGGAPEGWESAAVGSAGGLGIRIAWRRSAGRRETRMDWNWRPGQGTAREQLLAAQIVLAALQGNAVELIDPETDSVIARGTCDSTDDVETAITDLQAIVGFLSIVAEVETWLGAPLEPPAQPSEEDLAVLDFLVPRIRKRSYRATWTQIEVVLARPLPDGGSGEWAFAFVQPLRARLFGEERYLGAERAHIAQGRISGATGREGAGDRVRIVPVEPPGRVDIEILSPLEAPDQVVGKGNGRGAHTGWKSSGESH